MSKRRQADFRFYEELNDFLPPTRRKRFFSYAFNGTPAVKDAIEALGVPHPEVDLIIIDGVSVGFDRRLEGGERVAVYPVFEAIDIAPIVRLRPSPLREIRFVLDVHLGRLARRLRLLGFDTLYERDAGDAAIVATSVADRRIILTRDRELLKNGAVTHGYWVRSTDVNKQVLEVIRRFDIAAGIEPFSRCIACNGPIAAVDKAAIKDHVPPRSAAAFRRFFECQKCRKVYWRGSHFERMRGYVDELIRKVRSETTRWEGEA